MPRLAARSAGARVCPSSTSSPWPRAGARPAGFAPAQPLPIAFDNGLYLETGMQPSHTRAGADLVGVAGACGIRNAFDVADEPALKDLAGRLATFDSTLFARVR